jgi:hypothetical protein
LKLKYDTLLSNFAFKFKLRRYTRGEHLLSGQRDDGHVPGAQGARGGVAQGRAVQVAPFKPTLKAPGTKRLKLKYDEPAQKLLSNSTCAAAART